MARQSTREQKQKTRKVVVDLAKRRESSPNIARILHEDPDLVSYAAGTIRKNLKKWKAEFESETHSVSAEDNELSATETLRRMKAMIEDIKIDRLPIGSTAPKRNAPDQFKTKMVSARLPIALMAQLEALPGLKSDHVQRALKLYLRALKSE